jgi:hypothetical protein
MFAWLSPLWSALQTAARTTATVAKYTAQAMKRATIAAAKWTKATASKAAHAIRTGAGRAKDWLVDMRSPQLRQARWYARGAHKSLARATDAFKAGDGSLTTFELKHAGMEQANIAKLRSGSYPQVRLRTGINPPAHLPQPGIRRSAMTIDLPTLSTDTATGHTLAKSLREVADAARKGAAVATARAESLRAQAAAMDGKSDLQGSAAGLLAEAAMWEERAQNRLGTASAYEDAATAAETEEGK